MKNLETVLMEQILDLKVNEVSSCETESYPIFLDRTEKDNSKWLKLLKEAWKQVSV